MKQSQPLTAPKTYAGDIKAFANSRSLRETYFHFQMPRNIVSLFKHFGRRVFQSRTSSSCKPLAEIVNQNNVKYEIDFNYSYNYSLNDIRTIRPKDRRIHT